MKKLNKNTQGIALMQLVMAVVLIGVLIGIAIPVIKGSIERGKENADKSSLTILNGAADRARLGSISGAGTYGSDKTQALTFYNQNGFIDPSRNPNISRIDYLNGFWFRAFQGTPEEYLQSIYFQNPTDQQLGDIFAQMQGYPNVQAMAQAWGHNSPEAMYAAYGMTPASVLTDWYGMDMTKLLDKDKVLSSKENISQFLTSLSSQNSHDDLNSMFGQQSRIDPVTGNWTYEIPGDAEQSQAILEAINLAANTPGNLNTNIANLTTTFVQDLLNPTSKNYDPSRVDFNNLAFNANPSLHNIKLTGTNVTAEHLNNFVNLNTIDFAGINLTGYAPVGGGVNYSDFSNSTGFNAAGLNNLTNQQYNNYTGLDMTGWNPIGKIIGGSNLTEVTGLTKAALFSASNIQQVNLTNWDFTTTPLTQSEVNRLVYTNLNGVRGIPVAQLNAKSGGVNSLVSLGLQGWDLAELNTIGKNINYADFRNTNITGEQLTQANHIFYNVKIDPANLAGFNATGKQMQTADFGPTITTPAQFVAATGITPGPGTRWIDGTLPWG